MNPKDKFRGNCYRPDKIVKEIADIFPPPPKKKLKTKQKQQQKPNLVNQLYKHTFSIHKGRAQRGKRVAKAGRSTDVVTTLCTGLIHMRSQPGQSELYWLPGSTLNA